MADPDFENDVFFREVEFCFVREHPNAILGSGLRSQGLTDSCYAFAVVNCIYANLHIRQGISMKASEQLLLDCLHIHFPPKSGLHERVPGAGYANSFKNTFLYAISMGLLKEQDYPFVGRLKKCERRNKGEVDLIFSGLYDHLRFDEEVLEALRRPSAVAATVYATDRFRWWRGTTSIYTMTDREREEIEQRSRTPKPMPRHAITLIGYGVEEGIQYYLAQNSWGPQFGHNGFIKVERGSVRGCCCTEDCFVKFTEQMARN